MLAADQAEPGGRDSLVEKSFLAQTAHRLLLFDWMRGGGGASRVSSVRAASIDFESEIRKLEPYFGCTIDTIVVSGNAHTKTIAVLREMATKQGACLDERLIRRDSAHLRSLGYFAAVNIAAESTEQGRCRLLVTIVERPGLFMRVPYPVVNYDFEKGLSYGFNWKIRNFRGYAEDLGLSALMRRNESQGANFFWSVPWLTGRRILFRFDAFTYRRLKDPQDRDEDYIKEQSIGNIGLGFPLTRSLVRQLWLKTSLSFEGREARLTLADAQGGHTTDLYHQDFLAVGADIEYDSRSNRLSPFDGMFHMFRVTRFTSVSGPNQQYIFYGFSNYFYLPVGVDRSFIVALDGDIREGNIPSFFEMELGGVRDLRGFSNEDLRGTTKMVGTLQYRARLMGPTVFTLPKIGHFDITLNGVLFLDNGALMNSILDLGHSTIYTTGGMGVEILSPFRDLIRLEVASDGTRSPVYYVTAGTNF